MAEEDEDDRHLIESILVSKIGFIPFIPLSCEFRLPVDRKSFQYCVEQAKAPYRPMFEDSIKGLGFKKLCDLLRFALDRL